MAVDVYDLPAVALRTRGTEIRYARVRHAPATTTLSVALSFRYAPVSHAGVTITADSLHTMRRDNMWGVWRLSLNFHDRHTWSIPLGVKPSHGVREAAS